MIDWRTIVLPPCPSCESHAEYRAGHPHPCSSCGNRADLFAGDRAQWGMRCLSCGLSIPPVQPTQAAAQALWDRLAAYYALPWLWALHPVNGGAA